MAAYLQRRAWDEREPSFILWALGSRRGRPGPQSPQLRKREREGGRIRLPGQNPPPALQNKWDALLRERPLLLEFSSRAATEPALIPPINGGDVGVAPRAS